MSLSAKTYRWACQDLLDGFDAVCLASDMRDCEVTGIVSDSRQINPGDMFVMIQGFMTHGMCYIREALARGAKAILCDFDDYSDGRHESFVDHEEIHIPIFRVRNLKKKVGMLANKFFSSPSSDLSVIGVTGTNGKSSCAFFIAQFFLSLKKRCGISGTLGVGEYPDMEETGYTTPDVISVHRNLAWFRDQGIQDVVMEVSSHALDQGRVQGVEFETAIFTNLSHDHQDYHASLEDYFKSKSRLFLEYPAKNHIINIDDDFGRRLYDDLHEHALSFSCRGRERNDGVVADLYARRINSCINGDDFEFSFRGVTRTVKTNLIGYVSMSNTAASLLAMIAEGYPFEDLVERVTCLQPPPGRLEQVNVDTGDNRPIVMIDFAHTPAALQAVLKDLRPICRGKLWCVFGCGGERDQDKRPIMGGIAEQYADRLVITSDNPRGENPEDIIEDILKGISDRESCHVIPDRIEAVRYAISHAHEDDIVLLAGKGHETYQIVKEGERIPLNERKVAKEALSEWR